MPKTFKMICAFSISILIVFEFANAQSVKQRAFPESGQLFKMVNRLSTRLSLSEDQEKQLRMLYIKFFQDIKKEFEKTHLTSAEKWRTTKILSNRRRMKIKRLLTLEQNKKYEFLMREQQRWYQVQTKVLEKVLATAQIKNLN